MYAKQRQSVLCLLSGLVSPDAHLVQPPQDITEWETAGLRALISANNPKESDQIRGYLATIYHYVDGDRLLDDGVVDALERVVGPDIMRLCTCSNGLMSVVFLELTALFVCMAYAGVINLLDGRFYIYKLNGRICAWWDDQDNLDPELATHLKSKFAKLKWGLNKFGPLDPHDLDAYLTALHAAVLLSAV